MNILLLEDEDDKAIRVEQVLNEIGLDDLVVTRVENIVAARERLSDIFYDLLILDIRVPYRQDESPSDDAGVQLLKEILQDDQYNRPKYVVGLTGIDDLFDKTNKIFLAHGWALLQYSATSVSWVSSLKYFTNHISSLGKKEQSSQPVEKDIVIITALDSPEFLGLKLIFDELEGPRSLDSKTLIWDGVIKISPSNSLNVVISVSWHMGLTASAILAERLVTQFKPKLIAMTGICAGFSKNVDLGDVIVASQCWEWQSGKIVEKEGEDSLLPSSEPYRADQESITIAKQFSTDASKISELTSRLFPSDGASQWKVKVGPLASGVTVVSSDRVMQEVQAKERKVLGLDMEAYSIYATANFHPVNPDCIVIKGVCDFGSASKDDQYQNIASIRSAIVLRAVIEAKFK